MAEERGRAARFFEGFANALLERAVPRVREWLQARFGAGADVGGIRLDGRDVHVDDTRVPLGPRARLTIARATFRITGEATRPLVLHALTGEVRVDEGGFVAPVRFESSREVHAEAWIEGALTVERATWPRVDAAGEQAPLDGSLAVLVTSTRWTLARGAFTCADARIAIDAEGDLDASGMKRLSSARVDLRDARAAHFADAALAITGARMSGALTLLKEARVEGTLAWLSQSGLDAEVSATTERSSLRVVANAALDETVRGTIEGRIGVAEVMEAFDLPAVARPLDDDVARCEARLSGTTRAPRTFGTLRADVLRVRLGRPSFLPPRAVRDAVVEFDVDAQGAKAHGSLGVDDGAVRFDASFPLGGGERALKLELDRVPAEWASDLATSKIPDDARVSGELGLDGGTVRVTTARTRLAFEPLRVRDGRFVDTRLRGDVASSDLLTLGLLPAGARLDEIASVDGSVDGPLRDPAFDGTLRVRDVEVALLASRERVTVRFADAPALLGELASELTSTRVRVAGDGARPSGEWWLPRDAALTGEVAVAAFAIDAEIGVETATSAMLAKIRVGADGALDGSTVRGRLSFADAIVIGLFRSRVRPRPIGAAKVKAALAGTSGQPVLHADLEAAALDLEVPAIAPLPLREVSARLTVDGAGLVVRSIVARVHGGEASCEALVGFGPAFDGMQWRIRLGGVRIEEIALAEQRKLGAWLRGGLLGSVTLDSRGDGPLIGNGELRVDGPEYEAIALLAPTLSRHGLSTPSPVGVAPLVCRFGFGERGVRFDGLDARVDGVAVNGWTTIDWTRVLAGRLDVQLDARVVRNHALLGIPALFARTIPLVVDLGGTVDDPSARLNPLQTLGVADTVDSVTSAFAELFAVPRREPSAPTPRREPPPAPSSELDAILDRILDHDPRSEDLIAQLIDRGVDADEFERLLDRRRAARRRR